MRSYAEAEIRRIVYENLARELDTLIDVVERCSRMSPRPTLSDARVSEAAEAIKLFIGDDGGSKRTLLLTETLASAHFNLLAELTLDALDEGATVLCVCLSKANSPCFDRQTGTFAPTCAPAGKRLRALQPMSPRAAITRQWRGRTARAARAHSPTRSP